MNKGTLYICPTPIGNLKDITLRTIETLKEVDLILCEDTRITIKLLNHYEVKTKMQSYHKFNEKASVDKILGLLTEGKNIALVSDAGTPLISDPGQELVSEVQKLGAKIVPLPGANAVTTLMSAISNPTSEFVFVGFLPKKKNEKQEVFKRFFDTTVVFYESPNRIVKTLEEIQEVTPDAQVAIGRELTKMFEQIKQGAVQDLIGYYKTNPPKGEIVAAVMANSKTKNDAQVTEGIFKLSKLGYNVNEISKIVSALYSLPKKEVYQLGINLIKK